ncbi:Hypothetical predicted protein [Mytilus galloprovincialis]|uniref:Cystatin domain-containing protein n=1 Tax=Mytilus galloprovincialis TaxID=29158 RepID=A0A8B6DHF9_MYTGA|nr:Hypothetical predicted protein [Mytilus galloprovincialis]
MKIAIVFCLLAAVVTVQAAYSSMRKADSKVKALAVKVEGEVESAMGTQYHGFIIISYREEVSRRGTKYLLKVKTKKVYLHVKAFVSTSGAVSAVKAVLKKKNDRLEDF